MRSMRTVLSIALLALVTLACSKPEQVLTLPETEVPMPTLEIRAPDVAPE